MVYDQVLGRGAADHLSPEMLSFLQIVIAAYFGHSAVSIAVRALARRP